MCNLNHLRASRERIIAVQVETLELRREAIRRLDLNDLDVDSGLPADWAAKVRSDINPPRGARKRVDLDGRLHDVSPATEGTVNG